MSGNQLTLVNEVMQITLQNAGPQGPSSVRYGFLYIPVVTVDPSTPPTVVSGQTGMCYNTTDHKLWIYDTGDSAWKSTTLS